MSNELRKAAQDVVDAYNVPVVTIETENALIDGMNALRAAMQQPDSDAKQRLLEIMRRNGLATGHGDTLKQVIDTLEVELTDRRDAVCEWTKNENIYTAPCEADYEVGYGDVDPEKYMVFCYGCGKRIRFI